MTSSIATTATYQPATHHPGGPATQQYPPGTLAAHDTTIAMDSSVASHAQPEAAARPGDTADVARQTKPQAIASATRGAISGLTTRPIGLKRWNRAATIGAVTAHTAVPMRKQFHAWRAIRRSRRSQGERLRSMSRSIGSTQAGRHTAADAATSTAVDRNDSCVPVRKSSCGCQASTRPPASANELAAGAGRPTAAPRQASHTSSVARTTGVSAPTSVMYSPVQHATAASDQPRGSAAI